jgi:hypothetical protein
MENQHLLDINMYDHQVEGGYTDEFILEYTARILNPQGETNKLTSLVDSLLDYHGEVSDAVQKIFEVIEASVITTKIKFSDIFDVDNDNVLIEHHYLDKIARQSLTDMVDALDKKDIKMLAHDFDFEEDATYYVCNGHIISAFPYSKDYDCTGKLLGCPPSISDSGDHEIVTVIYDSRLWSVLKSDIKVDKDVFINSVKFLDESLGELTPIPEKPVKYLVGYCEHVHNCYNLTEAAEKAGLTKGRISQVLPEPGIHHFKRTRTTVIRLF